MIARGHRTVPVAVLTCFAAMLVLAAGCSQQPPGLSAEAESKAVRALSAEWLAADQARDVEKAVSFYADDAVELASNTPLVEGKEAIRGWYRTWLPEPNNSIRFATVSVEVSASGDMAWERGTYQFTVKTPKGDDVDTGKYLTVWKKVAGAWKVAADMANSDRPVPSASAPSAATTPGHP